MMHNVCSKMEKTIRVIIGVALFGLFFLESGWAYFGYLGFVPILTVFTGYCPISHLLGVNTCTMKEHHA